MARPLEEFLMTYKEVKRSKTVSTSQNGMCIVKVELNDYVNNKDEVWSKIKHGLTQLKMQLPSGVLALVAQDDFGDTSALLIAVESDTRSYSELKMYVDELSARLRRLPSVTNIKVYGEQQEQITLYLDRDKLSAYGIGDKVLTASLFSHLINLAALIVVLGMIVDNSIVVIDGYLELLSEGHSRWYSAIESAKKYFMSMLLGTVCVCVIFFPILFTMTGVYGDFVRYFPWTITINLMVSLLIAVFIVPTLEFALIHRRTAKPSGKPTIVSRVQGIYNKVLDWTFRHPRLTIGLGVLSVFLAVVIAMQLKVRMMPVAERDQFVVEIDLPAGTPLEGTAQVADSVRRMLQQDERVRSVTSFIGCSAPRFQSSYAPRMAGKNNAQLIVNTRSMEASERSWA